MKRILCSALCAALLLTGCAAPASPEQPAQTPSEEAPTVETPVETPTEKADDDGRRDAIQRPEIGTKVVIDPPYDFDPDQMLPRDFGDHFLTDYPVETETYLIAEGTEMENEVMVIKGQEEGPTIYIVAGVHGDEQAAWETGKQLEKISIKAGTLYILAPANPWGAAQTPRSRYVSEKWDLNRSFPGNPEGNAGRLAAWSIFEDIKEKDPIFVFDLHEARVNSENYDFLGSSLIYTSLDGMEDMYLDLLLATESGAICSERFNFYAPGPAGSLNYSVTTDLGIPTITIETYRGYPLERRISDQLDIVEYVLTYYGML